MEFNEKLQKLRKKKGITQEELAESLFVSRTAISKWESGRGYPNIDSLKGIANFFSVTIDELLSGEELLTLAEEDSRQKRSRTQDLLFGLLDCAVAMLLFLPFFRQEIGGEVRGISLLGLTCSTPYLRIAFSAIVVANVALGIATLFLQACNRVLWVNIKYKLSLLLNCMGALIFIICMHPYAAILLFVFLVMKVFTLAKWQ